MVNAGYYGDYYIWSFLSGMGSALVYLSLAITVATIVATWRIYDKAGEHGWASLIPIYAQYVLYRITWGNGWLFLLLLVPVVNVIVGIITLVKLAKSFGYGGGFACGLIFLNTIFMLILGFGVTAYLLLMIPFVSIFLIPCFVVSGILLYNEELETESDSSGR